MHLTPGFHSPDIETMHIRVEGDADPEHIGHHLRSTTGLRVSVRVETHGSLSRSEGGKLSRVSDEREL